MAKEISDRQGKAVASVYLGKLQRGQLSEDECLNEIRRKLGKEGYSNGSIIGVQAEFNYLAEKAGKYRW